MRSYNKRIQQSACAKSLLDNGNKQNKKLLYGVEWEIVICESYN